MKTNNKTSLGANYLEKEKSVEFKLYSKNATRVLLCLFDEPIDSEPIMELEMKRNKGDIWSTKVKDYILDCKNKPVFYGYRVFGPNWEYNKNFLPGTKTGFRSKFDKEGNRFNPNKIAYDPYSKEISHYSSSISPKKEMFRSGGDFHLKDNARWAIKSVYKYQEDKEIKDVTPRPFASEIIGEVHVKDLTCNLDIEGKGTFLGAKKAVQKIKDLGITMVEFLPINEFDPEQNGGNHWGYMPLGYFSLQRKYLHNKAYGESINEFIEMVDEFHKNGIKVCLDMVYNHTGEAGLINNNPNDANLLSYALIDNSQYYKVYENGFYRSNSGCGNDFNANSAGALNLIIDSLVFWINLGVDAFRFDLAAALLENSCNCEEIYDNIDSLAAKLKEKLKERGINVVDNFSASQQGVVLIAEPWTCGGRECYHLGNFPSFWAEWNDITRDTIRKITLTPKKVTPIQIKEVIEGTPSRFHGINKSINYIASHDGFCLNDLNSFSKRNPSTDGGSDWELCGDYNNDQNKKEEAIRKQLAILFLSYGIPMVQIGDILMHTKGGNNNSYNKDDKTNYLNWDLEENSFEKKMMEYTKNLINFRKENPIFESENFINSLSYHYDNGQIALKDNIGYWYNQFDAFFGVLINAPKRIYVAMSKIENRMNIQLPQNLKNKQWFKCLDTSDLKTIDFNLKDYIEFDYVLNPNSLVIFMEK